MMSTESSLSSEILAQAKTDADTPRGWVVLPLSRRKVLLGIVGWFAGSVTGAVLFAGLAIATIPYNYHSVIGAIITTILLGLLAFVAVGSAWALVIDALRLRDAGRHVIVITPEDFVKQEGAKIVHVPLVNVRHVTARGKAPAHPDHLSGGDPEEMRMPTLGENFISLFAGRGFTQRGMRWRRRRMRTPTSLAFIDTRSDSEVNVVTDGAYGDPFLIAAFLKQYAAAAQSMGH